MGALLPQETNAEILVTTQTLEMVTFPIAQVEVSEEVLEVQVVTVLQEVSLHPQVTDPLVVHPSVTAPVVAHPSVTVPAVVPHTDPVEARLLVTDPGEALFRSSGGSSYNPPRNNRPSLSGILSGVRTVGSNSGSSSSSGSSDTGSSSGAISFDA